MQCSEHHVSRVERVNKVWRHATLLSSGVWWISEVCANTVSNRLESGLGLQHIDNDKINFIDSNMNIRQLEMLRLLS